MKTTIADKIMKTTIGGTQIMLERYIARQMMFGTQLIGNTSDANDCLEHKRHK